MNGLFIAGTDTGIGKTLVSCALLRLLARRGVGAVGMKPVAAGLDLDETNEDVEALRAAGRPAPREQINPCVLRLAIAPHLAAAAEGREIRFAPIRAAFTELAASGDTVIVEGVGGFRVPLGPDGDSADLARELGLPIVLVVGLRLGCLNHALLTVEAIAARGLTLAGWVANRVDPQMPHADENLATLERLIAAPYLGVVPYMETPEAERSADALRLP